MKLYAVLTGDLIESSRLSPILRRELQGWLKRIASDFSELHAGAVVGALESFRGDSWQLCLKEPSLAVRAAVFIRVGLKAHPSRENVDSRIGIGVGGVDVLSEARISESNGAAFVRSGKGLDSLLPDLNFCLEWPDGPAPVAAVSQVGLPLLDLAISRWTHAESVAVHGAMQGWTQLETAGHELARKSNGEAPTRQAIAKALGRVGWSSHIEPVLEATSLFFSMQPNGVAIDKSNL